jgi:signal transduction histidine kinase
MIWENGLKLEPDAKQIEKFFSDVSEALLFVVDEERKVLFANSKAVEFAGFDESSDLSGLTLGDLLGCTSAEGRDGCGTLETCRTCELFVAIAGALSGKTSEGDYSLRNRFGRSLFYHVFARSFVLSGRIVIAISMHDISAEKRKEAMERVFYHDLLNSAAGLSGILEFIELEKNDASGSVAMLAMARTCASQLIDEINFIRTLSSAEADTLVLNIRPVSISHVLDKACAFFSLILESRNMKIECVKPAKDFNMLTDESIVVRVLVNLIKNALEAENDGATVTISAGQDGEAVLFEVHNKSVMSQSVKSQIFARAFSTKGKGRGIGTYSVQLFTGQYLNGRVSFSSEEGRGTSFFVRIPIILV